MSVCLMFLGGGAREQLARRKPNTFLKLKADIIRLLASEGPFQTGRIYKVTVEEREKMVSTFLALSQRALGSFVIRQFHKLKGPSLLTKRNKVTLSEFQSVSAAGS